METTKEDITKRLEELRDEIPDGVTLEAVSKFHPIEEIVYAYEAGQRVFGESRVQELKTKVVEATRLRLDELQWHYIGHLQTNKVRQLLALRPAMIESVDSERLLNLIDEEAVRIGITQGILMQAHVAKEETKTGFMPEELLEYFRQRKFESLKATHICGIMGMASNTDDTAVVTSDFNTLHDLKQKIENICPDLRGFDILSMGMSHDWQLAVKAGSTLIRVGTRIFGPREY